MSLDCWSDDYSFYVAYWRVDHSVLLLPPFPASEDDRWDANLKILDVFSIYSLQVSSFICLYHNGALPISFTHIFQNRNQIHEYSTRYSDVYRPHTCRTLRNFRSCFKVLEYGILYRKTSKKPTCLMYLSDWPNHF